MFRAVAIGNDGLVITSDDLIVWTDYSVGTSDDFWDIAWGNGVFVTCVSDDDKVYVSSDGIAWVPIVLGITHSSWIYLNSIAFGNGVFVLTGESDDLGAFTATSSNGLTWTVGGTPPIVVHNRLNFANNLFIGGDYDAGVSYSPNGINWDRVAVGGFSWLSGPSYGSGLYILPGAGKSEVDPQIYTSPDLSLWTLKICPISEPNLSLMESDYGAGVYVIVGRYRTRIYSLDGDIWEEASPPHTTGYPSYFHTDVKWSSEMSKFVCVGGDPTWNSEILTSSDGINWTVVNISPGMIQGITFGDINGIVVPTIDQLMRHLKWFSGGIFKGYYLGSR